MFSLSHFLTQGHRRWIALSAAVVVLFLSLEILHLSQPERVPALTRFEHLMYDLRFSLLPPERETLVPIVIVDIDETSIQQQGRWPWPRYKIAELVRSLQAQGVALLGLDIIFSESEYLPTEQWLAAGNLPVEVRNWLQYQAPEQSGDALLAQAVADNTILGFFFQNDGSSQGELPFPFYQLSEEQQERSALLQMDNYTANLPVLANHALGQGFLVAVPDMDGVVRRAPMLIQYQENVYASLAVVMAQWALGAPWLRLNLEDNGQEFVATHLEVGQEVSIPLSKDGSLLVPFKGGAGSFYTLSANKLLHQQLSDAEQELLQGAIVLVGTSALGLADLRTMPLQTSYPGVEVHANSLDAILQAALGVDAFYQAPDWAPALSLLMMLLLGLLLSFWLPGKTPVRMLLWVLAVVSAMLGLNLWLWQGPHLALPVAVPLLMVLCISSLNLMIGFVESGVQRHKIQNLFGAYVPPEYVQQMLDNPAAANMEGEQREMTVLFADVMGFTSSSEKLTTAQLKDWLNRYLTAVTQDIFQHQGTIDKYVGDMVMAFWNAPLADENHAQNGVLTALAMQRTARELAPQFYQLGLPPVAVGIGLNTGLMNVGDMGSEYRRAYTVLGDAVNLGSRLEALTRFYGVDILVSQATASQCPDILFLAVDRITVKGKSEPVEVLQPIGRVADCAAQQAWVEPLNSAIEQYRAREFAAALDVFVQMHQQQVPASVVCQLYIERCQHYLQNPPAAEWNAVYTHTAK